MRSGKYYAKLVIFLLLIVSLAGCGGDVTNNQSSTHQTYVDINDTKTSESTGEDPSTITDTPENGSDSSRDLPKYPRFVVNGNQINESELLSLHIQSLIDRNTSIQITHRQISYWSENESQLLRGYAITNASKTTYTTKIKSSLLPTYISYWENDSNGYIRNTPTSRWVYNKTWYGIYDDPHRTPASISYTERLRRLVSVTNLRTIQRGYTKNGNPRIIFASLHTTEFSQFTDRMAIDKISTSSLRVATRQDGTIANATWRLNGTYNGEPVNRTETWTYEYGVNISTRPDWLETAREEAQEIEVTHPTNITYKIEHLGDKTVPAGARIAVLTPTATTHITFDQPFEPTDVVYIAAPNESLETYRTRPSGDEFQPLPSRVSIGILIGPANAMGDSHPESFRWREFLVEEAD